MIGAIIIGIIAGWLAGKLVRGKGYGIFGDLILGLVGGLIGGWIIRGIFNVPGPSGVIGAIVVATIGAVILVWIAHLIRGEV
ncbi:MAG: GlsB/YeaQ/YmgE family stress response membrane protein [Candidatus Binataceae bacterium]